MSRSNYWERSLRRRRLLAGSASAAAGVAGLALVGCGDDDDDGSGATPGASSTAAGGASPSPDANAPKGEGTIVNGEEKWVGKTPVKGGVVKSTYAADPPTWDPHTTTSINTFRPASFFNTSVLQYGYGRDHGTADVKPQPNIAASWEWTDDTTMTLKIDPKATWTNRAPLNGRAIKASDVKFTYERILQTPAPFAGLYSPIETMDVPDEQTLVIKLKHVYAPLENYLAHYYAQIVAPEVVDQFGDLKSVESAMALGSGPFELESFTPGTGMRFKRRENYWREVYLDAVEWRNSPDANANLAAARAGDLDIFGLTDDNMDSVIGTRKDVVVNRSLSVVAYGVCFRTDATPTSDERVRQAFALAVDREGWLKSLFNGHGSIDNGPIQALWSDWRLPPGELGDGDQYLKYDADRSRKMFQEAGLGGYSTDFPFTAAYGQVNVSTGELYKDFLGQVGVTLNYQILEYAAYITQVLNSKPTYPNVAMFGVRFMGDPDEMLWEMFHPEGSKNFSKVNDAEVTALLEKQRGTLDTTARKSVVDDLQRMLAVKNYYVYSPAATELSAWQPWVAGYRSHVSYDTGNQHRIVWIDEDQKS